jgi:hypothetical protein
VTAVAADPGAGGGIALRPLTGARLAVSTNPAAPVRIARSAAPVVAAANAGGAPGLTAEQSTLFDQNGLRGLAVAACAPPSTQFWFAGGAAAVGRTTEVVLVNPDATPASADIVVYGPNGRIEAPAGIGVAVPASGRTTVRLDALTTGATALGVSVRIGVGRSSVALLERQVSGTVRQGVDWVPATAAPARRQVVPGVFSAPDRTLILAAPGERQAAVTVEVLDPEGAYTPVGLESLTVPAGGSLAVPLEPALAGVEAGLRITSDEPVIAGVRLVRATDGTEFAYTAASPALGPEAAAAENPTGSGSRLMLSSVGADAVVELALIAPGGTRADRRTVRVAADSSVIVDLIGAPGTSWLLQATGGPVHAARLVATETDPGGFSVVPVVSRPTVVAVPPAGVDPAVGIPGH